MHAENVSRSDPRGNSGTGANDNSAHYASVGWQAARFLTCLYHPPWHLYVADPSIEHGALRGYVIENAGELAALVDRLDGWKNIYFPVTAPCDPRQEKKASKHELGWMHFVHADLDRQPGETVDEARRRCFAALQHFPLPPHVVVNSGNGVNALWLIQPSLDGQDPALRQRVEMVNKALLQRLTGRSNGGEWNVDRILRLPHTTNLPTLTKQARGWGRAPSSLEHLDMQRPAYKLEAFEAVLHGHADQTHGHDRAETGGPDLNALWQCLPPDLQSLIAYGAPGSVDRSRDFFDVVRWLHTLAVKTDVIEALLRWYPEGPAGKYLDPDRLREEVSRIIGKLEQPGNAAFADYGWRAFDQITSTPDVWAWQPFIPCGELTALIGRKAIGKTALLCDLAARWSSGRPMPSLDGVKEPAAPPRRILWLGHEDRLGALAHRFGAAGANLGMIGTLAHHAEAEDVIAGSLLAVLPKIAEQLARFDDWGALIIEPITSFLDGVKAYDDTQVRRLLHGLHQLAKRHRMAVIYSIHMNKKEDLGPLNRALGSVAFVNVPRSVLFVNRDPSEEGTFRLVGAGNMNEPGYAPGFRIRRPRVFTGEELIAVTTRVEWQPESVELDAEALMAGTAPAGRTDHAIIWLRRQIATGPLDSELLRERADAEAVSWRTVERARQMMASDIVIERGSKSFTDKEKSLTANTWR